MKLISIEISNYRSIKSISIPIEKLTDGTSTYGLIGVNEVGKSSILKALALKDGLIPLSQKDFRDTKIPVLIILTYEMSDLTEKEKLLGWIVDKGPMRPTSISETLIIEHSFDYESRTNSTAYLAKIFDGSSSCLPVTVLPPGPLHTAIFWTAEEKYLISHPISLETFAANPSEVSVPLKNCFLLAGIKNIEESIHQLADDSAEVEHLQTLLGDRVTDHINAVWPHHPIKITFLINNGFINFHIKDTDIFGKAKTAEQRSDGFKQFVSFLLTVSAQNKNEQLSNSLLLLDEPETHLHPQAQEYLLAEVKKISKNERNNVVVFATHSNFMIDKEDLSRNFRITKEANCTKIERLSKVISSYNSVNFDVFDIASSDYHTELYAKLHLKYQMEDENDQKRSNIQPFDESFFCKIHLQKKNKPSRGIANQVTLSTYIRNCINHPDNGNKFSTDELLKSINLMRRFLA